MSGQEHGHHKNGDGGFWAALTAFILLLIFFFLRTDTGKSIYTMSHGVKIWMTGIAVLLDIYAFYRKLKHHDYSIRQNWTNFIIWMTLIFAVPGLVYYLFLG